MPQGIAGALTETWVPGSDPSGSGRGPALFIMIPRRPGSRRSRADRSWIHLHGRSFGLPKGLAPILWATTIFPVFRPKSYHLPVFPMKPRGNSGFSLFWARDCFANRRECQRRGESFPADRKPQGAQGKTRGNTQGNLRERPDPKRAGCGKARPDLAPIWHISARDGQGWGKARARGPYLGPGGGSFQTPSPAPSPRALPGGLRRGS